MGQYGRGHLARSTHLPAISILPPAEVLFLKSKITEVYANDPEASRKHLILLPRVSQKGRKAFALFQKITSKVNKAQYFKGNGLVTRKINSYIIPHSPRKTDEESGPGMKFGSVIYSTNSGAAPTNARHSAGCLNCLLPRTRHLTENGYHSRYQVQRWVQGMSGHHKKAPATGPESPPGMGQCMCTAQSQTQWLSHSLRSPPFGEDFQLT